jgi:hypothetical protein
VASDIDLVIRRSKRLERLLREEMAAKGRGLHELTSSVERQLPDGLVRRLRFIATVRNKLVHDDDVHQIDKRRDFSTACDLAEKQIKRLNRQMNRNFWLDTRFWLVTGATVLVVLVGMLIAVWMLRQRGQL